MLQVLKVKVHFYLVSPPKYELWLDKRQLNVAFCARDISCNRKMGLSLKIYDIPYWTKAPSTLHPSNQPPESASNAHHPLMNVINPTVGSLWIPFKVPPAAQTYSLCKSSSVLTFIHSVKTEVFMCQQRDNNKTGLELCKQTFKQILQQQRALKRQETMKWWKLTKRGCNDGVEKQKGPFLFNQAPSELPNFSSSPSPSLICISFMSLLSHYANADAEKVVRFAKRVAPFPHTFLINTSQGRRVMWCSVAFMLTRISEPFSLNCSYLGNQPTEVAAL